MPLSDREQEMLDQIEQALYAEDPKFATNVRVGRSRTHRSRWLLLCAVGVVVGLAMVFVGVAKFVPVGVLGFVVIVASGAFAASLLGTRPLPPGQSSSSEADGQNRRKANVRNRMEDRLKRRFDEG